MEMHSTDYNYTHMIWRNP